MMQTSIVGLVMAAVVCTTCMNSAQADGLVGGSAKLKAKSAVPPHVWAFDLADVRLLDGPFKRAMEANRSYLLSLDPDRLLHTFRLNAGIPSTARPLGGWEEPKGELRGHFVGHYLTACALMYASTGDQRLKQNAEAVVKGMAECQAKIGSGYLSAYPEEFFDRVEKRQRVWAPYYTLHKIYAGLLDMYLHCNNQQALEVCRKFADWVIERNSKLSEEQMQRMLGEEHGGMNEVLANLYAVTGEEKYLKIAMRFNHMAVIGPASQRQDRLTGLHANTQVPKFIGTARQYELTGQEWLKTASIFFWDTVVKERSYVIGGHSDGEMFSAKERLSQAFGPSTTETCNTYNMLKLTRHLFCWEPTVERADYYERALYNHILASQNPENGMTCYYVPLRPGSRKSYSTPTGSFWCCTGTGVENHAKYGDSIYFHDDQSLYVNLFIASELNWKEKGLKVMQETTYPEGQSAKLTMRCEKPTQLAVKLRWPAWSRGFMLKLNGQDVQIAGQAGQQYITVDREWRDGDTLALSLVFSLRTEGFKDNPNRLALLHGPLVLSAEVDPKKPMPAIVGDRAEFVSTLKAAEGKASTFTGPADVFRVPGEAGKPITLEPFYKMHGNRPYTVYFDVLNGEQWKALEQKHIAEAARKRELAARTVDVVIPGQDQNERDHRLKGEKTSAGDFGGRKYRHATDGGSFSWELKVQPDEPQELWVMYWGSDVNRTFDILIDGQKLATQRLANNKPGEFFDEAYALPEAMTKGKQSITVTFQAPPNSWAGGVFGVRVMKKSPAAKP